MAKPRKLNPTPDPEGINLIPIMNLVSILIPFMLLSTVFVAITILHVSSPRFGPGTLSEDDTLKPTKPLHLTVVVTDEGFRIKARAGVLSGDTSGDFIPKAGDDYDYERLTRRLAEIKALPEGTDETNIIVTAEKNIRFEILARVMDATRRDGSGKLLFPDVVLSTGVV